ncbi:MAG: hypothetical protein GXP10_01090 [Gammaproteobacteria bacterium]|nr:hypothetical protein [Gammaproteobacteria bacterium]
MLCERTDGISSLGRKLRAIICAAVYCAMLLPSFSGLTFAALAPPEASPVTLSHTKAYPPQTLLIETLPSVFIKNVGQLPSQIKYYQVGSNGIVTFLDDGIVFNLNLKKSVTQRLNINPLIKAPWQHNNFTRSFAAIYHSNSIKLSFIGIGKNHQSKIMAHEISDETFFAHRKKDNKQAAEHLLNAYEQIIYKDAYPGIDICFNRKTLPLSYDIVIHPGANPNDIILSINEFINGKIDSANPLPMNSNRLSSTLERISVYQYINGRKITIQAAYRINKVAETEILTERKSATYKVNIGAYNKMIPLIMNFG